MGQKNFDEAMHRAPAAPRLLSRVDKGKRRKGPRKVRRSGIPRIDLSAVERDYFSDLGAIVGRSEDLLRGTILEDLDLLLPLPSSSDLARAGAAARIQARFERMEKQIEELAARARRIASRNIDVAENIHRQQVRSQLSSIGFDVYRETPQLAVQVAGFTKVNTKLITSIPATELDRVESLLLDAVRQGRRHEAVAKDIEREFEIATNRAKLIARDQIGKISSDLSRARMTANGVTKGVWRTSRDERVRDAHEAREGRTFDLDNGIEGEHPGGPIRCRCYTEPHL